MNIHQLQELAASELFQNAATTMIEKDMDYYPDACEKYVALGLPEGMALYAYDDGICIVDTKNSCNMCEAVKLVYVTTSQLPREINQHDNGKLMAYIKNHYINVISCTSETITVESQYCKDGKAYTEPETIQANMKAVRDYLGY